MPKIKTLRDGIKRWHLNGKLHREDGPAIIETHGEQQWYLNGNQVDQLAHWMMRKEFEKVG